MSAPALAPAQDRAAGPSAAEGSSRARRTLIVLIVLAMLAAVLASVARSAYRDGLLEPDAPTGQGAKAVVQVLEDLEVDVEVRRHTADAAEALRRGETVLVTEPSALSASQLALLDEARAGGGTLVLVQPEFVTLGYFTAEITPAATLTEPTTLDADAGCEDLAREARGLGTAGQEADVRGASTLYRTADGARSCFRTDTGALVAEADGVVVLGSADLLRNDGVGLADNSALALNLLGGAGELTWYVPSASDPLASTSQTLLGYLPDWAGPLVLWLLGTAVVALVALGRRFGPVVIEPLPVSVRPQELVHGRARLMQRAGARDGAASALRAAAAIRLAEHLGLRHETGLDPLLAALSAQLDRPDAELRALLGPTPVTTDQGLVRLAHDLDRLEKEIDR